ncbi:Oxidored-FMN domain-containing protein [Mycena kentingensis (nom. inval.)]|nr:Oxidored-FMN domain-containing protein [Mycena kentingensis (nom. inval.)]
MLPFDTPVLQCSNSELGLGRRVIEPQYPPNSSSLNHSIPFLVFQRAAQKLCGDLRVQYWQAVSLLGATRAPSLAPSTKSKPLRHTARAAPLLNAQPMIHPLQYLLMASLFSPIQIGSHTVANRIGMAAMTRSRCTDTRANDIMLEYYLQRAKGGAALIVTEGILVSRQGSPWPEAPVLWDESQVAGWKRIVDAVHAERSRIYAQLGHIGRAGHPDAPQQIQAGVPVYAPSAIAARGGKFRFLPGEPGYVTPTEVPDPAILVEQFKASAMLAKKAGFDGVELHNANGYLMHQFLDSSSNKRTDDWGGSVAGLTRFALETIKVCQAVFGADVAIKFSPNGGYNDMGMPLPETLAVYGHLFRCIDALPAPLAYVCLAQYNPLLDAEYPDAPGVKRATPFDVLATFASSSTRKEYFPSGRTQLWLNSGVQLSEAERLIRDGTVDGVFFGLNWLTHPDLAKRIEHGKPLDNVPDFAHLYGEQGEDPSGPKLKNNLGVGDPAAPHPSEREVWVAYLERPTTRGPLVIDDTNFFALDGTRRRSRPVTPQVDAFLVNLDTGDQWETAMTARVAATKMLSSGEERVLEKGENDVLRPTAGR